MFTWPTTLDACRGDSVVADLVARAGEAHVALMRGDVQAYRALMPQADEFVLMSPFGGEPSRGPLSRKGWVSLGRFFAHGRNVTLELVHAWHGADMVVLAVIERAHVEVGGMAGQDWALRVTMVFREQEGRWMLVHRHADPLVERISLGQAAALAWPRV